jgi:hypothetical protein
MKEMINQYEILVETPEVNFGPGFSKEDNI